MLRGLIQRFGSKYDGRSRGTFCIQGSQRRLEELEQAWPKKRLIYQQQLKREGEGIRKAKRFLGVIDGNPEHFRKVWKREEQVSKTENVEQRRIRGDRDRGLSR